MKTNWLYIKSEFWMISPYEAMLAFLIGGFLGLLSILIASRLI